MSVLYANRSVCAVEFTSTDKAQVRSGPHSNESAILHHAGELEIPRILGFILLLLQLLLYRPLLLSRHTVQLCRDNCVEGVEFFSRHSSIRSEGSNPFG